MSSTPHNPRADLMVPTSIAQVSTLIIINDDPALAPSNTLLQVIDEHAILASSLEEALTLIQDHNPGVIVTPLKVNGKSALHVIKGLLAEDIDRQIVVISKSDQINDAAEAMRLGATECLFTPFSDTRLQKVLDAARAAYIENLKQANQTEERRTTAPRASESHSKSHKAPRAVQALEANLAQTRHGLILSDLSVRPILEAFGSVAESTASVFIQGETGTGKEVLARALHAESDRRQGPFVMVDCTTLRPESLHTDLFGHPEGEAVTPGTSYPGLAVSADGGTLFLDRICEADLDVQKQIVRFLDTGEFRHQQDATHQKLNVRIISTSRADPNALIASGALREDLYYRLCVAPIHLPPLKNRGDDVMRIAQEKLTQMSQKEGRLFVGFAPDTTALLRSYDWPGNIRQLINVIWNIALRHDGVLVTPEMLPDVIRFQSQGRSAEDQGDLPRTIGPDLIGRPLIEIERLIIEETIRREGGSVPRAAHVLGVSPSTLYRKRESWKDR